MNFIENKPETGRNLSFIRTFEELKKTFGDNSINIVETGTIRSNSDTCKFGDGWSTLNWKYYADNTNSKVWSVDNDSNVISISNSIVPSDDKLTYVHNDSIEFLKTFDKEIDLLFLDSYDYHGEEENLIFCWNHCLNEIKASLDKLSPNAFILIDDVYDRSWNGKGKIAIPFLLENGWEVVHFLDSQVLLKRKTKIDYLPKVSCVMTTYGRYTCVQNSIGFFLRQDYKGEKELIIYNTCTEHPYELADSLKQYEDKIIIVNNNTDKITGKDYTNVGSIRRDAIDYATGELYICWDDDDVFLPFNITQCVKGILNSGKRAWKPKYSFFWKPNNKPEYAENVMEASVIVYIDEIRKRGFREETGSEHCGWYQEIVDEGKFMTDSNAIPSYCFNWSRSTGPSDHKQSGDINNPNNFENHKKQSTDFGNKLEFVNYKDIDKIYENFYEVLRERKTKKILQEEIESLNRYVPKELVFISAQPDDNYFAWQIEVQIHNYRKYNYAEKMHVLVYYKNETYNKQWDKLVNTYTDVKFFFYKDTGAKINKYIPILRPHICAKHFKQYPELKDKAIFYHDSDIIFSSYLDFTNLCVGDTWYLSDTVSYIGARYIKSKGEYIFEEMCRIVDVDQKLIEENEENSGGAQYLMKNVDSEFWGKVEKDIIPLYEYMNKCNTEDLFLRNPRTDIQSWCSDMWAVLWNAIRNNNVVLVDPILNFSWATSMLSEYYNCKIFHNAGATSDRTDLFYKGKYISELPYNLDLSKISDKYGSYFYAKLIKEVSETSCLK